MRHVEPVGARVHRDDRAIVEPTLRSSVMTRSGRSGTASERCSGSGEIAMQRLELAEAAPDAVPRGPERRRQPRLELGHRARERLPARPRRSRPLPGSDGRLLSARRRSAWKVWRSARAARDSRSTCRSAPAEEPTTSTVSRVRDDLVGDGLSPVAEDAESQRVHSAIALLPVARRGHRDLEEVCEPTSSPTRARRGHRCRR
jgi:hypothetical protein